MVSEGYFLIHDDGSRIISVILIIMNTMYVVIVLLLLGFLVYKLLSNIIKKKSDLG